VLYDEQIGRGQAEHDDRVPVDAVTQPTPPAPREVLVHSQRVDVPDSAALEIARRSVVNGVSAPPKIVWRERQYSDYASDPVVGGTAMEEGTMTAIVLDHEKPHEKACGRHREQQAEPVA
jgi:hypothetical protein